MGVFDGLPCTDADIAEQSTGDFAVLTPRSERLAYGTDGVIGANSMVLTSGYPFATRGVEPGHVLVIHKLTTAGNSPTKEPNDFLPVALAADGSLTLRRIGYVQGKGAYPMGMGTSGITYFVPTVLAQIMTAYQDILRRLGLTAASPLVNPTDLRLVTIKTVLRELYWAAYRQTNNDTFKSKSEDLAAMIADLYASLDKVYGSLTPAGARSLVGPMDVDRRWRIPSDGMGRDPWDQCGPSGFPPFLG